MMWGLILFVALVFLVVLLGIVVAATRGID